MELNREISKSSSRIRRRKITESLAWTFTAACIVIGITIGLTHIEKLYITRVAISGNTEVADSAIFNIANGLLSGQYYGLYPKSNILIYPKEQIASTLLRVIPWLDTAEVSATGDTVAITVTERQPAYLWCDDLAKPIIERVCYYLDKSGFAFDKAPSFSGHVYLEFYGGDKRGGYFGRHVLNKEELNFILSTETAMNRMLAGSTLRLGQIYGVYIYNNGDYDMLVSDGMKEWQIKQNMDADPLGKLSAILDSDFFQKELSAATGQLLYIDLRFGQKVFYKFSDSK